MIGSIAEWENILLTYQQDLCIVQARIHELRRQHRASEDKAQAYMKLKTYLAIRDDLQLSIASIKNIINNKETKDNGKK